MQKNSRKVGLLLAFVSIFATAFFVATAFAQFVGPGSTPPAGSGTLQVDTNYNVGLGTSSSAITPTTNLPTNGFGRLFAISSTTNPGFSLFNGTNRYTWYADTASGTLSLWTGAKVQQITPGGSVYGYDYHSINDTNYYVDPGMSLMPYSALFAGSVGIGTTAPGAMLHIVRTVGSSGALKLEGNDVTTGLPNIIFVNNNGGATGVLGWSNSGFGFTGGNVGIGTTSPAIGLTVEEDNGNGWSALFRRNSNSNGILFGTPLGVSTIAGIDSTLGVYQNLALNPSGGKVGIGTTNPGSLTNTNGIPYALASGEGNLQVDNNSGKPYTDTIVLYNNGCSSSQGILFADGNSLQAAIRANRLNCSSNYYSDLQFYTQNGGDNFQSLNNVRMTIDYAGNVGIGTTTPTTAGLVVATNVGGAAVDVQNNRIINVGTPVNPNDAATMSYVNSVLGTGGGGTSTGSFATLTVSGTTTLATVSGRVGIGTASPSYVFQATQNTAGLARYGFFNTNTTAYQQTDIDIGRGTASADLYIGTNYTNVQGAFIDNRSGGPLYFKYNGANIITVATSGYVGIGTTTPTTAGLVVAMNVSSVGIDVNNNRIQNVGTPINAADAATKSYVDSAFALATSSQYWTLSGSNLYPDSTSYNVGIGTTTPSTLLQVGNGGTTGKISVNSQDNSYGQFQIGNPSSGGEASMSFISGVTGFGGAPTSANGTSYVWDIGAGNYGIGGNKFGIGNQSYGGPILVVQANGSVGIGTTTPGTNLDVNGNINASIYYDRANSNYYVEPSATILPYSIITAGSVGIMNTAPTYNLDVGGTFRATGNWSLGGGAQTDLNLNTHNIIGVNKLSVTSIDPLYNIGGVNYSTYAPSISGGVKEEYVGQATLATISNSQFSISNQCSSSNASNTLKIANCKIENSEPFYQYTLDFNQVKQGSDLWVWRKAVDFSSSTVEAFATPIGTPASIAYQIEGNSIVFIGTAPVAFSYRLVGSRFDWKDWPTLSKDQNEKANLIIK